MAFLQRFTSEFGEFFFLRKAAATVLARTDGQAETVRSLYRSAKRRIAVAQALHGEQELPVAMGLSRDALRAALAAHRAAAGEEAEPGRPATVDAITAVLGEDAAKELGVARAVEALEGPGDHPLALDDRDPQELSEARAAVEDVTTAVVSKLEVRTPKELKFVRGARWAAAALALYLVCRTLFGLLFAPTDIARDKLVTVSSLHPLSPPVQALVDGKKASLGAHTTVENEPWIQVDLGGRYALKRVHVQNRTDGYYDETLPWVLEIADGDGPFVPVSTLSTSIGDGAWDVDCGGQAATRIRVRSPRTGYLALGELSAYGAPL